MTSKRRKLSSSLWEEHDKRGNGSSGGEGDVDEEEVIILIERNRASNTWSLLIEVVDR